MQGLKLTLCFAVRSEAFLSIKFSLSFAPQESWYSRRTCLTAHFHKQCRDSPSIFEASHYFQPLFFSFIDCLPWEGSCHQPKLQSFGCPSLELLLLALKLLLFCTNLVQQISSFGLHPLLPLLQYAGESHSQGGPPAQPNADGVGLASLKTSWSKEIIQSKAVDFFANLLCLEIVMMICSTWSIDASTYAFYLSGANSILKSPLKVAQSQGSLFCRLVLPLLILWFSFEFQSIVLV